MFNRSSNDSNADRPESLPVEISRVQTSGSRNGSLPDAMVAASILYLIFKKLMALTWPNHFQQDDSAAFLEDFDELMRSGTTMKVSLTPDRLRTMEVSSITM